MRASLVVLALVIRGTLALAQPAMAPPDLSEPLLRALEAPYLAAQERAALRNFHGLWNDDEPATTAVLARRALLTGSWDHPALADDDADPLDRAEAALARGEPDRALALAREGRRSVRASRLEGEALEALGRRADADALLASIDDRHAEGNAPEMVDRALAMLARSRVREGATPAAEYHAMLGLLARARDKVDRLYWPASLAEARILYSKGNLPLAQEAALETLRLNPRAADAWFILGRCAVDGFDFDRAAQLAARLDRLQGTHGWAGASILAAARSRQNDPEGALALLEPALARFPTTLSLRLAEVGAVARLYDEARLEETLRRFDDLRPGSALALLEAGKALAEARQYDEAASTLRRASGRDPWAPEPWVELGLLEVQAARDHLALDALRKGVALDPFSIRAGNTLRLMEELVTYSRVESDHFIIRFKPGLDEVLASEMPAILDEIHARVAGEFEHEPPFKTLIELMPDHRWFSVRIAGLPRIHTMAAATGPAIAMESPREGRGHMVGPYDWPRVIQHEYAHTVTLSRTRNRIPHWFTEAAAVHMERSPRAYDRCLLLARALAEGTLFSLDEISLKFVRPETPTDRAQAYAQGHWMYEYIVQTWGERAPLDLMDLYARGTREPDAFRDILGVTPDAFMLAFEPWAREQVRAWGLLPPAGTPSLRELLTRELPDAPDRLEALAWASARAAALGARGAEWTRDLPTPTRAMVDRWLAEFPDHPDVLELAVQMDLARRGGQATMEAAPLLERYARARPMDPMPHRRLAALYLSREDPSQKQLAVEHLEFLDAREQHSPVYAIELARRHASVKDWDTAAARAERATRLSPFDADYREFAATMQIARGDLDQARRHLLALAAIEPDREIHRRRLEALERKRSQGS